MTNTPRCFVFGSNLAGIHGAGSAKRALEEFGAIPGRGVGPNGNPPTCYAIPTKDEHLRPLSLDQIQRYVVEFYRYAAFNPRTHFDVVAVGTGYAGYTHDQMAPLFAESRPNVHLPLPWRRLLKRVTPFTP